jgi:Phage tail tube protein
MEKLEGAGRWSPAPSPLSELDVGWRERATLDRQRVTEAERFAQLASDRGQLLGRALPQGRQGIAAESGLIGRHQLAKTLLVEQQVVRRLLVVDHLVSPRRYSNNLEKIETIRDDGLIEDADPTIAALTGRIDVRFADTTLIDLAAGGTPVDLEFAYTLSTQTKLVLTAHEVYLPKPKLAVEGPGGVQASFDFRGAKDVAGRMLTVTLTNDLDGTVYG